MEKSLVANANEESKVKVPLNKNGKIQFEPYESIKPLQNVILQTNILKKILIAPNNVISSTRSSRPEAFCKKGVLRNFTKFTGKHLCQNLNQFLC